MAELLENNHRPPQQDAIEKKRILREFKDPNDFVPIKPASIAYQRNLKMLYNKQESQPFEVNPD